MQAALAALFVLTAFLWYLTSKIVPTDSLQLLHRTALQQGYLWL